MILAPHTGRRRKPLHRSVARAIWCWVTRRRARILDVALEAAAAPVLGPETLAQAAQRERGFDPIHPAPPPLLAARLEVAAVTGLAEPAIHPPAWVPLQPQKGPVPPAMADVDGDRPWEFPTGQWPAFMDNFEFEGEQ